MLQNRLTTTLFVQHRLNPVMAPPAEEEQGIIVFAHMELLFDDGTEAVDLFSHISTAAYDVDGIHPADICQHDGAFFSICIVCARRTGSISFATKTLALPIWSSMEG